MPKYIFSAFLCLVSIVGAFRSFVRSFVRIVRSFVRAVGRLLSDLIARSFVRSPNIFVNKNI